MNFQEFQQDFKLQRDDNDVLCHHPFRMSLETDEKNIVDDIIVPSVDIIVGLTRAMLADNSESVIMFSVDYPVFEGLSETDFIGAFRIENGTIHGIGLPYNDDEEFGETITVENNSVFLELVSNLKDAIGLDEVKA